MRSTAPPVTEYRHPLARYSFRAIYADSANRGRIAQKDLGMVYSRDILGEPGTLAAPAPRLLADAEAADEERAREESPEAEESSAQAFRVALVHSWDELRGATTRVVQRGGSTAVGALQHQIDRRRRGAEPGSAPEAPPQEQSPRGSSEAPVPGDDDAPAAAEGQGPGRRG